MDANVPQLNPVLTQTLPAYKGQKPAHYSLIHRCLYGLIGLVMTCMLSGSLLAEPIFAPEPTKEQGWQPLANILNKLTPSIDTDLPLTGDQINDRIITLINSGQAQEALEAIERREAQLAKTQVIGTDVQLLFLKARAYSSLAAHHKAYEVYQQMTTLYPELPEPWNNLAIEYVRQGNLDRAQEALDMALIADPNDKRAWQNLGTVRLLLAEQAFEQAQTDTEAPSKDAD